MFNGYSFTPVVLRMYSLPSSSARLALRFCSFFSCSGFCLALANLKVLNIFPTSDEFDVIAYSDSKNCSYKSDGGIMQLDNFRSGGYMLYKVYNRFDAEYEVEFEFAHANDGAQMEFQILVDDEESGARLVVTDAL